MKGQERMKRKKTAAPKSLGRRDLGACKLRKGIRILRNATSKSHQGGGREFFERPFDGMGEDYV